MMGKDVDGDDGFIRRLTEPVRTAAVDKANEVAAPLIDGIGRRKRALDQRISSRERRRARREVLKRHRRIGLPFPWRVYVQRSRNAYRHLIGTIESLPDGPLLDELLSLEPRVVAGLDACAEAAGAGNALSLRADELRKLVPSRRRFARNDHESTAVRSSRAAIAKLEDAVNEARARLSEGSLAMVEVATHALDLTVGGEMTPRVERLVEDLVALESSLQRVPRKGFEY